MITNAHVVKVIENQADQSVQSLPANYASGQLLQTEKGNNEEQQHTHV